MLESRRSSYFSGLEPQKSPPKVDVKTQSKLTSKKSPKSNFWHPKSNPFEFLISDLVFFSMFRRFVVILNVFVNNHNLDTISLSFIDSEVVIVILAFIVGIFADLISTNRKMLEEIKRKIK